MRPSSVRQLGASTRALARKQQQARKQTSDPAELLDVQEYRYGLTSAAHRTLEHQREYLRLLRLEQFEFPKLKALRQPFTPPGADEFVRVRTQHYQGEAHPADRKAVITLRASSISLRGADKAAHKLRLLAGAHWDSDKDELKIACERFGTKAQNERWCSETLDRLVAAAEDLSDPMDDIKLDTRATDSRLLRSGKRMRATRRDIPADWLAAAKKSKHALVEGRPPTPPSS